MRFRFTFARVILIIIVTLGAMLAWTRFHYRVDNASLSIPDGLSSRCEPASLKLYPTGRYNPEVAANDFLLFGIAALNAYEDKTVTKFVLEQFDASWKEVKRIENDGLHLVTYIKDGPFGDVLVALRGTRLESLRDLNSNLSWFTGGFTNNEYNIARDEFKNVQASALARTADKKVRFTVVGHSLAGGIAYHLAYGFPCTSAVGLDTSPVWNAYVYEHTYPAVTINLHDTNDLLTKLSNTIALERDTEIHRWYPMKLDPKGTSHSILRFAVGMAGLVTNCQERSCPEIPKLDDKARRLYCPTYGHNDGLKICEPYLHK